jgi:hypothetical protein
MSCDENFLSSADRGSNLLMPVRKDAIDRILEALGQRKIGFRNTLVAGIVSGETVIALLEWWWRDVIAAAPDENLLIAELCRRLCLVQTLERSVVALVETPGLVDRNPEFVEFIENDREGAEGALQDGHKSAIEAVTFLLEEFSRGLGLAETLVIEINIGPTGESVFAVPSAFAVADED